MHAFNPSTPEPEAGVFCSFHLLYIVSSGSARVNIVRPRLKRYIHNYKNKLVNPISAAILDF